MTEVFVPDLNAIDDTAQPVVSLVAEADLVGETETHRHRKAQLLNVISGVLTSSRLAGFGRCLHVARFGSQAASTMQGRLAATSWSTACT